MRLTRQLNMRQWRNWQTRKIQVLVPVRVWRFKSFLPHQWIQSFRGFNKCCNSCNKGKCCNCVEIGLLKAKPQGWYPGGHNKLLRYYPSFWEGIFIFSLLLRLPPDNSGIKATVVPKNGRSYVTGALVYVIAFLCSVSIHTLICINRTVLIRPILKTMRLLDCLLLRCPGANCNIYPLKHFFYPHYV